MPASWMKPIQPNINNSDGCNDAPHAPEQLRDFPSPTMFMAIVLVFGIGFRLCVAAVLPLGVDESYAITVARQWSWSFFDHPPLAFWLAGALGHIADYPHPLIYRAPFIAFGIGTTYMVYRLGVLISGTRAGLISALLLTLSPVWTLINGTFVLPDAPLGFFSTLCLLCVARGIQQPDSLKLWIGAGVALAAALASKYQALLIPISLIAFAALHPSARFLFFKPGPYIAALVSALGLVPLAIWNLKHSGASFSFHVGRVGNNVEIGNFFEMLLAQALYIGPMIAIAVVGGLVWTKPRLRHNLEVALLFAAAVMPIAMFHVIYLISDGTLPHWTLPGWLFAVPLAGAWLASRSITRGMIIAGISISSAIAIFGIVLSLHAMTGILTSHLASEQGTQNSQARVNKLPQWDDTLQAFDYSELGTRLQKRGLLDSDPIISMRSWIQGGQLGAVLGRAGIGTDRVRITGMSRHHFAFLPGARASGNALFLFASQIDDTDQEWMHSLKELREIDNGFTLVEPIVLARGSNPYVIVRIARFHWPPDLDQE